jgi:hypothetical protein
VVPSIVSVGTPKVGDTVTRKVVVRGTKPFKVMAIEGLGDGMQADLPQDAAPVQTVTFKYLPPKPGELKRQLQIITDQGSLPPITVNVEGNVQP